jgi:hypothetical protein
MTNEDAISDSVAVISRATARRLAAQGRPESQVEVEAAIAAGPNGGRDQYVDPISLGALIVSIATLAWQVYTDLKASSDKPSKEVVARRVRIRLQDSDRPSTTDDQKVIDIVVDETVKEGDQDN